MSQTQPTNEDVLQLVYTLRKFGQEVVGGPHDRAADMLEQLQARINFLRARWAECQILCDMKTRENSRFRRTLSVKLSNIPDADMDELIRLHNEARQKASWAWSINPLVKDGLLMAYAQQHAEWMAESNRMRHSAMRDIMKLGYNRAAENIAWGQETPESVMRAWLWSPGHRRNIMSTSNTNIGCGACKDSRGRLYWCVCFGRPKA